MLNVLINSAGNLLLKSPKWQVGKGEDRECYKASVKAPQVISTVTASVGHRPARCRFRQLITRFIPRLSENF